MEEGCNLLSGFGLLATVSFVLKFAFVHLFTRLRYALLVGALAFDN
jgi:hypothetical protein